MRRAMLTLILLASVSLLSTAGCGGGSSYPPAYGAAHHTNFYLDIETLTTLPNEVWPNVSISGYADPNYLGQYCDPVTDQYCIAQVYPPGGGNYDLDGAFYENAINSFSTDNNGEAYFYTDAQPAPWNLYANGPQSNDCSSTIASYRTPGTVPFVTQVAITCGSFTASMTATPGSCETGFINENPVDTCPATVTLTFPPSEGGAVLLPTGRSLTEAMYDTSGSNLGQSSVTAVSPASVSVPTPLAGGTTYLAVRDPSTNQILGVAEFTVNVVNVCTQATPAAQAGAGVQPMMNKCP
jgi:hypothetical protein